MSVFVATFLLPLAQWDHHDMDGEWWVVMGVGMVLFWGLVAAGLIWIVRTFIADRQGAGGSRHESSAIEILERRFAEGDIDVEEYRARRSELEQR